MRLSMTVTSWLAGTALSVALAQPDFAQAAVASPTDSVEAAFTSPPMSARPRVWWHWMNGNVSAKGIDEDLDWMARIGIGGVHNFDIGMQTPQVVKDRLAYMTPAWKAAFRQAVNKASSEKLEFAIASSPGFSETGGPWVPPKDAMKKLVWTQTDIAGGKPIRLALPQASDASGPYQGLAAQEAPVSGPRLYRDIGVFAFPTPPGTTERPASVTADGNVIDPAAFDGSDLDKGAPISVGTPDAPGSIEITFSSPVTLRSMTVYCPGAAPVYDSGPFRPTFEVMSPQGAWTRVANVTLAAVPITLSFTPTTGARFRLVFTANPNDVSPTSSAAPGAIGGKSWTARRTDLRLSQLTFSSRPRVNEFQLKDGFSFLNNYYDIGTGAAAGDLGIKPADVIDLSDHLDASGHLEWKAPVGKWTLLRLGYSLTGKTNHPASSEATGLEVDKMDGAAVSTYLDQYLDNYRAIARDIFGAHGINAMLTDSIEAGPTNWTPHMVAQFERLRGYDPTPWMPVLAGIVIGTRQQSDGFLYDFRRTIADLIATEHYGTIATRLHQLGLKLYGEAVEGARWSLGDDIALRRFTDIPMAAMWTYQPGTQPQLSLLADMKGAASVAHVYGQNLVAAESLTAAFSPWAWSPADLQPIIDLEFAYGVNRPVIHTSVHQPVDDKLPGLSLGPFGQYFNRHETWADMAKPWIDYMARNSVLLQAGVDHSDVAYFFGEEAPLIALFRTHEVDDAPTQYAFDYVDTDGLLNELSVEHGDLVGRHGARYRVLYLGKNTSEMTVPTLRRLSDLATAGATIVGVAPASSPSLADKGSEFASLVGKLWSGDQVTKVGAGRVIAERDVEVALSQVGLAPDLAFAGLPAGDRILFVHRRLPDGDVYYLTNRSAHALHTTARFRITDKAPEIWRADDASRTPVSYRMTGETTQVPLTIAANDSFFVVFRKSTSVQARTVPLTAWRPVATLEGGWDVRFDGVAAPRPQHFERLHSLTQSADPATKYFSGRVTYRKIFRLPAGIVPGSPVKLSLGAVGDVAEVRVNGQMMGTVWRAPYDLDIGAALRSGDNQIDIKVADLWVNRLIGDAQPAATKVTYTSFPTYEPTAPLRPAGLMGPVVLKTARVTTCAWMTATDKGPSACR